MPSFAFKGFNTGAQVALSAAQGSVSANGSVTAWGQGNTGTVSIQMVQGALVAPAAVWFEATGISGFNVAAGAGPGAVYEPGFHDITFVWDFGETGNTSFEAPLNIPDAWNDRNIAYGRRAAHVFRTPGPHTVTLWCVDSDGTVGQASVSITVADPDDVFTGSRTICFASDGNFANAPSGAQQITSQSALRTAIGNLSQSGRILFRRGSQTVDFALSLGGSSFDQDLHFGAWGSGERPILRPVRDGTLFEFDQGTPLKERTFYGLDLKGSWEASLEVGGLESPFSIGLSDAPDMLNLVHDCRLTGFETVNLTTLKAIPFLSIISDSIIEGWERYGFYGSNQFDGIDDNSRVALIGTAIQQEPDACRGNIGEGFGFSMSNEQGPLRYATTKQFVMRCCYFYSNTTWTGASQPPLRIASRNDNCELIGDRVVLEGGTNSIDFKKVSGSDTGNFLIDRLLMIGTADTNRCIITQFSGLTIRNAYGWMPNVPRYSGATGSGHFEREDGVAPLSEPVKIYNTSIVYMPPGGSVPFVDADFMTGFSSLTLENNLHYAPNQNTPEIADAPDLSQTIPGVIPRYPGPRESISKPQATASGSSAVLTFAYPTDLRDNSTTSASDYTPTGRHYIRSGNNRYYRDQGDLSVTLGATITVTKTSGTWPAGTYNLGMEYLGYVTDSAGASPGSVPLPRPVPGTSAYQGGGQGYVAPDDLMLLRRPGLAIAGSVPGTDASKGSVEP